MARGGPDRPGLPFAPCRRREILRRMSPDGADVADWPRVRCGRWLARARRPTRTGRRLLLVPLVLLFPQLLSHAAARQTDASGVATDRAALAALYRATDGANWKTSTNWLSGEPLSTWHGVLLTTPSGRVRVLSLPSNRLHGALPAEIASLAELELLNLTGNDLGGVLPTGLMNLTGLHTLWTGQVDLCAPRDPAFEAWLETIDFRGMLCPPQTQSVIDVAVFYTPAARDFAGGGVAEIESLIDSRVAETNVAYAESGVNQRLSLVAAREVAHTEGDAPTDQERLVDESDGVLDGVHAIRDEVAADVVILLGDYDRGFADVMIQVSPDFEDRALGVASVSDVRWFAHELGHIMGLRHDRHLECHAGHCSPAAFEDGYGYVNQAAFEADAPDSARWYTIMAYGAQCVSDGLDCEPVLRFSNPDLSWPPGDGDPMGIPGIEHTGTILGPANAARALNRTRETVSQFRMDANEPPAFTSLSAFGAAENQTAAGTVRASDGDTDDDVTGYAITGGADQAFFSIGATSGVLTFNSAPNYEAPSDTDTNGGYVVEVQASSGAGERVKTATQTITVTVTDVGGEAPGKPDAPNVSPASVTSLTVKWSAPDNAGPAITDYDHRHRTSPAGSWTEVTGTTSTALSATITGLAEGTSYDVQVRATNDEGTGSWSDAGSGATDANAATPEITSAATFSVDEGSTTVVTLTATDADADPLTWSIPTNGGDDAARFMLTDAGGLAFTTAPDYETPADADGDNVYAVTVQVSDGETPVTAALSVTVENVIELATAVDGPAAVPYPENGAVRVATYTASSAEDRDGITWILTGDDKNHFSIDNPKGVLRFHIEPDADNAFPKLPDYEAPDDADRNNDYEVTVFAGAGTPFTSLDPLSVTVTVTDENEAGAISLTTARPKAGSVLTAALTDPDGVTAGTLTWQWERSTGPGAWVVIDGAMAAGYTPTAADTNAFLRVTATYDDEHGSGHGVGKAASNVVTGPLLTALEVTTDAAAANPARAMNPAFGEETLHYAIGCNDSDTMQVTLRAPPDVRVAVDGRIPSRNSTGEMTATIEVTPTSDVPISVTDRNGAHTVHHVHCLDARFYQIEAGRYAGAEGVFEGLLLFRHQGHMVMMDSNGVPRFRETHADARSRTWFFRVGTDEVYRYAYATSIANRVDVLDQHLEVIDEQVSTVAPLRGMDPHAFVILPNGNYLLMSYERKSRNLSHLTFTNPEGNPYAIHSLYDSAIQIITPDDRQALFTWNSWGKMPLEDCVQHRFAGSTFPGYAHLNSLQLVGDHTIVGSFRGCSKVLGIDVATGSVKWRVGRTNLSDEEWASRDIGPAPIIPVNDPEGEFCGQHSATILPNGHLLLYDNGAACLIDPWTRESVRTDGLYSRAVEYALDHDAGEVVFVRDRSLHGNKAAFGYSGGQVVPMDNGDWLISWGRNLRGQRPLEETVTQVDPATGQEKFFIRFTQENTEERPSLMASPVPADALADTPGLLTAEIAESPASSAFHLGPSDAPKVVVAFSRPVADFAADTRSISLSGATIAGIGPHVVAGDPANAWLFTLTPTGVGPIAFALVAGQSCASGGACTADGTVLTEAPASHVIPPRATGPAVTSIASSATHPAKDGFTVTIAFSEPVTGLAADEIGVTNATGSNFAGAGAVYTLDIAPDAGVDGEVRVTVRAGAVTDAVNNASIEATAAFRVDTKAPALAAGGAAVNGAALLLVFDEALHAAPPPASALTVTAGGASRGVTAVSVSGSSATLTLDPAVTRGDGAASVSYAPPAAGGLRDALGNPAAAFADEPVANETPNAPPAGRPTIRGSLLVGETLEASVAGIADADGLDGVTFRYRWIRSDGTTDSDIGGAVSAAYTMQPADERRALKVRVSFTDGGGTAETLTSLATATVAALTPSVDAATIPESSGTVTVSIGTGGVPFTAPETIVLELGGTAAEGTDYTVGSKRLTTAVGATAATTEISAVDDRVDEGDETIEITARLGGRQVGELAVTILDDDERGVAVSVTKLPVPEGGTSSYRVSLGSQPTSEVEVAVVTELAGTELSVDPTTLRFTGDDWHVEQAVAVTAEEDADAVADAAVTLRHAVQGGDYESAAAGAVVVTIVENDTPTLSAADARGSESAGAVVFEVGLSLASGAEVTVDYATSDGPGAAPARAGSDYTATAGTLSFPAGTTVARTIRVPVIDDAHDDAEEETFALTLRDPNGASLSGGRELRVVGTIEDDDDPEVAVAFGAARYTVSEGASVNLRVVLSADPERTVEVPLVATPEAGAGPDDYRVPASVTFVGGETARVIAFAATDDLEDDDGESVRLGFGMLPPRVGDGGATTVAIRDNDGGGTTGGGTSGSGSGGSRDRPPVATDEIGTQVLERGGTVTLDASQHFRDPERRTLTFTAASADPAVAAVTVDGAAVTVMGLDHGHTRVTLTATDRRRQQATQEFEVRVGRTVSFADAALSAPEGDTVTLTVTVDRALEEATTLSYVVGPDADPATADADAADHAGRDGTVTLAAGATAAALAIAIHDDADIEAPRETFAVTLLRTDAPAERFGLGAATASGDDPGRGVRPHRAGAQRAAPRAAVRGGVGGGPGGAARSGRIGTGSRGAARAGPVGADRAARAGPVGEPADGAAGGAVRGSRRTRRTAVAGQPRRAVRADRRARARRRRGVGAGPGAGAGAAGAGRPAGRARRRDRDQRHPVLRRGTPGRGRPGERAAAGDARGGGRGTADGVGAGAAGHALRTARTVPVLPGRDADGGRAAGAVQGAAAGDRRSAAGGARHGRRRAAHRSLRPVRGLGRRRADVHGALGRPGTGVRPRRRRHPDRHLDRGRRGGHGHGDGDGDGRGRAVDDAHVRGDRRAHAGRPHARLAAGAADRSRNGRARLMPGTGHHKGVWDGTPQGCLGRDTTRVSPTRPARAMAAPSARDDLPRDLQRSAAFRAAGPVYGTRMDDTADAHLPRDLTSRVAVQGRTLPRHARSPDRCGRLHRGRHGTPAACPRRRGRRFRQPQPVLRHRAERGAAGPAAAASRVRVRAWRSVRSRGDGRGVSRSEAGPRRASGRAGRRPAFHRQSPRLRGRERRRVPERARSDTGVRYGASGIRIFQLRLR